MKIEKSGSMKGRKKFVLGGATTSGTAANNSMKSASQSSRPSGGNTSGVGGGGGGGGGSTGTRGSSTGSVGANNGSNARGNVGGGSNNSGSGPRSGFSGTVSPNSGSPRGSNPVGSGGNQQSPMAGQGTSFSTPQKAQNFNNMVTGQTLSGNNYSGSLRPFDQPSRQSTIQPTASPSNAPPARNSTFPSGSPRTVLTAPQQRVNEAEVLRQQLSQYRSPPSVPAADTTGANSPFASPNVQAYDQNANKPIGALPNAYAQPIGPQRPVTADTTYQASSTVPDNVSRALAQRGYNPDGTKMSPAQQNAYRAQNGYNPLSSVQAPAAAPVTRPISGPPGAYADPKYFTQQQPTLGLPDGGTGISPMAMAGAGWTAGNPISNPRANMQATQEAYQQQKAAVAGAIQRGALTAAASPVGKQITDRVVPSGYYGQMTGGSLADMQIDNGPVYTPANQFAGQQFASAPVVSDAMPIGGQYSNIGAKTGLPGSVGYANLAMADRSPPLAGANFSTPTQPNSLAMADRAPPLAGANLRVASPLGSATALGPVALSNGAIVDGYSTTFERPQNERDALRDVMQSQIGFGDSPFTDNMNETVRHLSGEVGLTGVGAGDVANVMINRTLVNNYADELGLPKFKNDLSDRNQWASIGNPAYNAADTGTEYSAQVARQAVNELMGGVQAPNATDFRAVRQPGGKVTQKVGIDVNGNRFGNYEGVTADQVAALRGNGIGGGAFGVPSSQQIASDEAQVVPAASVSVKRPNPRPSNLPTGFGDAGVSRTVNPYSAPRPADALYEISDEMIPGYKPSAPAAPSPADIDRQRSFDQIAMTEGGYYISGSPNEQMLNKTSAATADRLNKVFAEHAAANVVPGVSPGERALMARRDVVPGVSPAERTLMRQGVSPPPATNSVAAGTPLDFYDREGAYKRYAERAQERIDDMRVPTNQSPFARYATEGTTLPPGYRDRYFGEKVLEVENYPNNPPPTPVNTDPPPERSINPMQDEEGDIQYPPKTLPEKVLENAPYTSGFLKGARWLGEKEWESLSPEERRNLIDKWERDNAAYLRGETTNNNRNSRDLDELLYGNSRPASPNRSEGSDAVEDIIPPPSAVSPLARQYLGPADPYNYGFGAERDYYSYG